MFAEACSLAVGSENGGVKLQAIKFVEAAALAYSAALSVPALLSAPLASELRDGLHFSIGAPVALLLSASLATGWFLTTSLSQRSSPDCWALHSQGRPPWF
jgi:drug/metabolite transporter (DMT)-like permease